MKANVNIEVDEHTADVLAARAAKLGVTVSELVAELASLDSDPVVVEPDEIEEPIGAGRRSTRALPRSRTSGSSGGCAPGARRGSARGGPVNLDWSEDASLHHAIVTRSLVRWCKLNLQGNNSKTRNMAEMARIDRQH